MWVDVRRETTAYLMQQLTFHALGCRENRGKEVWAKTLGRKKWAWWW